MQMHTASPRPPGEKKRCNALLLVGDVRYFCLLYLLQYIIIIIHICARWHIHNSLHVMVHGHVHSHNNKRLKLNNI